jgi:hypothetical protein
VIDVESYCRDIEAYLCRKNDGHLIRITGAAFEQVTGWANQGVPIKIAEAGIDRYFERYYRKGPRRRPVRIEFCEADVLDAFDEWRRAVGVTRVVSDPSGGPDVEDPQPGVRARRSLASQIESALTRLTVLRGSDQAGPVLGAALERAVRALDQLAPEAGRARGDARDEILRRLADVDRELAASALEAVGEEDRRALEKEADEELAPFRSRLTDEAYRQSRAQAVQRLVRDRFNLPALQP